MKKAWICGIGFFCFVVLFTVLSCFDYTALLHRTKKKQSSFQQQAIRRTELVPVDTTKQSVITSSTQYELQQYDLKTNQKTKQVTTVPACLVGMNRTELVKYLSNYMKDVPLEDHQKGLLSFELLSFSTDQIVLRKTYSKDIVPFAYYLVVQDGKIVVYYSDKKTVYEYTDIQADQLPETEYNQLVSGVYVKDEKELYERLENYSS